MRGISTERARPRRPPMSPRLRLSRVARKNSSIVTRGFIAGYGLRATGYRKGPSKSLPVARSRSPVAASVLVVLFPYRLVDLLRAVCRAESLAKILVSEQARYPCQGLQMRSRGILRSDEKKEEVGETAVERLEVDAGSATPEGGDHSGEFGELAMRDGDALADRGGAELLALGQDLHAPVLGDLRMMLGEYRRELFENLELRGSP